MVQMKKLNQLNKIRKDIKEKWIGYFILFILGMFYGWAHYWIESIIIWIVIFFLIRFSDEYTGRYKNEKTRTT